MEPQNRKRVPWAAYQVSSAKPAIGSVTYSLTETDWGNGYR